MSVVGAGALPPRVSQKRRPAGPSLRRPGGNWGGPEPSSEPSLPAASPPRNGDSRANPGSLTLSFLPPSGGLSPAHSPRAAPGDSLPASGPPSVCPPQRGGPRPPGPPTGMGRKTEKRRVWEPPGASCAHILSFFLTWFRRGKRERLWVWDLSAGPGVSVWMCARGGGTGG